MQRDVNFWMLYQCVYTRSGASITPLPPLQRREKIAVIFVEDPKQRFLRHGYISVSCHWRKLKTIPLDSVHLDPMCYPLLLLYGERGWQRRAIIHGTHKVTLLGYIHVCVGIIAHRDWFDRVTRAQKLYQQYLVNIWGWISRM